MKSTPPVNLFGTTGAALWMWLDQMQSPARSFFPPNMLELMLGGDEISTSLVSSVFADLAQATDVEVRQVYGPTEGTVLSSYGVLNHQNYERKMARRRRVPIERLMPHAAMTVADPSGNELPRGFVGEIIIWVGFGAVY
jgi:non-ribosomal peptide synthetase component F